MTSTTTATADWYVDPLRRFDGRFFDGFQWTDQVSCDGLLQTDSNWPALADDVPEQAGTPVEPVREVEQSDRRLDGERRLVNLLRAGQPERRQGDRRVPEIVIPTAED